MADENDIFHARISASDDASKTIEEIKARMVGLIRATDRLGHAQQHVHNESVWHKLRESTSEAKEHFSQLGEHVSGVGEKITELLPALGALGAAGGLVALFETAEKTAEAYGELAHTAQGLGVSAQQLHVWNTVAKLTDTNAESMDKSLARLNRTLGDASSGKNKDAARLFAHLHLNPKSFKDSADALPALANAFAHTHSATMRARMAFTLFGRAGMDMIPMLMRGAAGVRELQGESARLAFNFTGYGEGLEHYNESMKKLGIATQGFTDEIGAKLAPVLQPIVDDVTDWVVANRDWIATGITGEVAELAHWLEAVDWKEVGTEIHQWAGSAEEFIDQMGGAKRVVEVLAGLLALKGVFFLGKETLAVAQFGVALTKLIAKLTVDLVGAWFKVGVAAEGAAAKEVAALEVGAKAVPGGGALGPGIGAGKAGIKALGFGLLAAGAAWDANVNGVELSQEDIRDHPAYGNGMTPAQIAALPKSRGLNKLADDTLGATPEGHSFVGDKLAAAWHAMVGGGEADAAPASVPAHSQTRPATARDRRLDPETGSHDLMPPATRQLAPSGEVARAPARLHPHGEEGYTGRHDALRAAPSPGSNRIELSGQASVTVFLPNAPPGTTAAATGTGVLAKPTVQLGQAFGDHYGDKK